MAPGRMYSPPSHSGPFLQLLLSPPFLLLKARIIAFEATWSERREGGEPMKPSCIVAAV